MINNFLIVTLSRDGVLVDDRLKQDIIQLVDRHMNDVPKERQREQAKSSVSLYLKKLKDRHEDDVAKSVHGGLAENVWQQEIFEWFELYEEYVEKSHEELEELRKRNLRVMLPFFQEPRTLRDFSDVAGRYSAVFLTSFRCCAIESS